MSSHPPREVTPGPEQSAQSGGQNDLGHKLLTDLQNGAQDYAMIGSGVVRSAQGLGMVGLGIGRSVYDLQVLPPLQIFEGAINLLRNANHPDDHRNDGSNRSEDHRNGNNNRSEDHRNGNNSRSEDHRNGNNSRSEDHRNGSSNRSEDHNNGNNNRSENHGRGNSSHAEVPTNHRHGGFHPEVPERPYDERSKNKDFEHTSVWKDGKHQVWVDKDSSLHNIGYTWKDTDGHYRGWKLNPDSQDGQKGRWVLYDGSKVLGTATDVKMTKDGLSVDGKLQDLSKPTTHGPQ